MADLVPVGAGGSPPPSLLAPLTDPAGGSCPPDGRFLRQPPLRRACRGSAASPPPA
jgi:flagellar M-ring protein FliF